MKLQPNFYASEFACKCGNPNCKQSTGEHISLDLVEKLQVLRDKYIEEYGESYPIRITSGIRCELHPIEAAKTTKTGTHLRRIAADIACSSSVHRYRLMKLAYEIGFGGIAYSKNFIHLDVREDKLSWVY